MLGSNCFNLYIRIFKVYIQVKSKSSIADPYSQLASQRSPIAHNRRHPCYPMPPPLPVTQENMKDTSGTWDQERASPRLVVGRGAVCQNCVCKRFHVVQAASRCSSKCGMMGATEGKRFIY
ncbi:unnamed protein product [Arctogadus glacialis]